jgi:hypothetical protein
MTAEPRSTQSLFLYEECFDYILVHYDAIAEDDLATLTPLQLAELGNLCCCSWELNGVMYIAGSKSVSILFVRRASVEVPRAQREAKHVRHLVVSFSALLVLMSIACAG